MSDQQIEENYRNYRQYLGADLPDMPLISKFNKGIPLLLCIIDVYSKDAWVTPLKY